MLDQKYVMDGLYNGIVEQMKTCGFDPQFPAGTPKGGTAVYAREQAFVMDFAGSKGRLRLVYSGDRIHLLSGAVDVDVSDDTAFNLDSTFLFVASEYDERDLKSLVNEINEYLEDAYKAKKQIVSKSKAPQTVSKAAAKSGALAYDPITLASKLAGMFPELKDDIKENMDAYGEFLCEDFFVNHANEKVMGVIRENNPQRMKKLFNILGEIYEDGTNEVQSLIAVTVLGPINNEPTIIQRILPYLSDTMLEPVLAANKRLAKSKSAQLRLEHPPAYKPKKQKRSGGILQNLMGGGNPGIQR
ncbi:MAG: hypothetical protein IJT27_04115 [Clostridia bacterium]|nr:hypothetical protein [Clostridia bacterium]